MAITGGIQTSTVVVSLTIALKPVTSTNTVNWNDSSLLAPASSRRPPNICAAPVRTMAADSTNIEVTISSAGLPKPWNACPGVKIDCRPASVGCQGTSSESMTSSAVTSGRRRCV